MLKGLKVVFVAFTQHCIQSDVTLLTHVERVERSLNSFNCYSCYSCRKGRKWCLWLIYHNIDTFNAMSKGSKEYVMLKQGSNTFLLITFLIFNQFSIRKKFWKAETLDLSNHTIQYYVWSKGSKSYLT